MSHFFALNAETGFLYLKHDCSSLGVSKKTSAIVWEVITVRLVPLTSPPRHFTKPLSAYKAKNVTY
jgi:hypothetical protein